MERALQDKDVQGLKHFARLLPLLDRLQEVGCERDTAGNRKLFFNDYVKLVLLYMWNPLIASMRMLQSMNSWCAMAWPAWSAEICCMGVSCVGLVGRLERATRADR